MPHVTVAWTWGEKASRQRLVCCGGCGGSNTCSKNGRSISWVDISVTDTPGLLVMTWGEKAFPQEHLF